MGIHSVEKVRGIDLSKNQLKEIVKNLFDAKLAPLSSILMWSSSAIQCSQIVDGIYPLHSTTLLQKKQFFKYNLGKLLKYITFSSCSLIIFESLPKLYLKTCFLSIKCQNGRGKFHPRSGRKH